MIKGSVRWQTLFVLCWYFFGFSNIDPFPFARKRKEQMFLKLAAF